MITTLRRWTCLHLFAGIGGCTLGFKRAGLRSLGSIDFDAKAIEQRSRRCLLEDRNARWIGQLETLFQDGPCLVAVGAVHLVGPEGLLAALRRDGYKVEAMPL